MAGGAVVNTGGGKDYPGKLTMFVLFACVVAATGGLIFGYDIGISGGVTSMNPFLIKFFPGVYRQEQEAERNLSNQYCKFDSQLLTMFTSSLYLAALVASFFAATVTRVAGRKWSMFAGGVTFLVGAALNGAAKNVLMLILGRVLLGIGVGFANQVLGSGVPVGDGAGEATRDAQHRLPADDHHRHPLRQPHQLRHGQDQGRLGLARQPRSRRGAGRHHRRGLALPPRHPQLPHRPRLHRRSQAHAPPRARHGQHRRGVQRPGGRQRRVQARKPPVAQHPAAALPAPARLRHRHPLLPAAHGHQRHHVLRARPLQDARVRRRRLPHVRRHHGPRQRLCHLRVHRHRRPSRPPQALPPGRRPDAGVPDRRRRPHRRQVRLHRRRRHPQGLRRVRGALHLRLRRRLRLVLGPARVARPQRDLPAGDQVGGAEHHRLRQHVLHLHHRAGVPPHALPLQVHALLLLRRLGARHDPVRRLLPTGDQERAHRGDGARMEVALVLEPLHPRRGRARRRRRRDALQRQDSGRQAQRLAGRCSPIS